MFAIDRPDERAAEAAALLRAAGAGVSLSPERFTAVATRGVLLNCAARGSAAARPFIAELLRALDAVERPVVPVRLRDRRLETGAAAIMGILNVTPDSFFDSGKYNSVDRARLRAEEMVRQGAAIVDVGGQSYAATNPQVAAAQERERVVPVVEALVRDRLDAAISVDTFRASVAQAALDAGAHAINDCSGLRDPLLAPLVARYDAALVVMHLKGELNVRERAYHYDDVVAEVSDFLRERCDLALAAGVRADALIVDPGLEFGKDPPQDLELLDRFGEFRALGYPLLLAASRKSFIGSLFGLPAKDLLVPSLAAAAVGIAAGARIVRVHDVAETSQLSRMLAAVFDRDAGVGNAVAVAGTEAASSGS